MTRSRLAGRPARPSPSTPHVWHTANWREREALRTRLVRQAELEPEPEPGAAVVVSLVVLGIVLFLAAAALFAGSP